MSRGLATQSASRRGEEKRSSEVHSNRLRRRKKTKSPESNTSVIEKERVKKGNRKNESASSGETPIAEKRISYFGMKRGTWYADQHQPEFFRN